MNSKVKPLSLVLISFLVFTMLLSGCEKTKSLELSGTIETSQIDAAAEVSGKVIQIQKQEGDLVQKGDVIAILDSSYQQLVIKQQEAVIKLKKAKLEELKAGARPEQIKYAIQAAEADLEQSEITLEQAKLTEAKYNIRAPVSGTFILKNVDIGDIINTGGNIGTISDLADQWVSVYIPQKYLKYVSLNQLLSLKVNALNGAAVSGKVIFIASEAEYTPKNTETDDAKENTVFRLKIKIMDKVNELKPGMTVDTIIPIGE